MWTFFVQSEQPPGLIRIAWTKNNPKTALSNMQQAHWADLHLLGVIPSTKAEHKILLEKFAHLEQVRKWFKPDEEFLQYISEHSTQPPEAAPRGRPRGQAAANAILLLKWLLQDPNRMKLNNNEIVDFMGLPVGPKSINGYLSELQRQGYIKTYVRKYKGITGQFCTERLIEYTGKRGVV